MVIEWLLNFFEVVYMGEITMFPVLQEATRYIPIKPETARRLNDYYANYPIHRPNMEKFIEKEVDKVVNDIISQSELANETSEESAIETGY
jgi:hypothetical protein